MSPPHTLIVLSRDTGCRLEWLRQAERGVLVLLEREVSRARARLAVPLSATLVVCCRDYELDDVLDVVRAARLLDQPVPVVLLTDALDQYRAELAKWGLVAEVLSSVATPPELIRRLGLEPARGDERGLS